jgi:glycosyltransferase involved in cell wall biosynthesis
MNGLIDSESKPRMQIERGRGPAESRPSRTRRLKVDLRVKASSLVSTIKPLAKESSGKIRIALAMEHPLLQEGGTEVLVRELVRRLAEKFEIVLVTGDRSRQELGDEFGGLIALHFSWNRAAASPAAAKALALSLAESNVKLAHFHGGLYEWQRHKAWRSPIFYLTGRGVSCLVTNHLMHPLLVGYSYVGRPAWQKALLLPKAWLSTALIMSRIKTEVMVSKHDQKQLQRYFPPFAGKIQQMYHSRLTRESRGLPLEQRQKTVLCLGSFCERTNQTGLTRAFISIAARHPEWSLHMIGNCEAPSYLEEVRQIIASSGLSGRIRVSPPENDPSRLLAAASIFVMPSLVEGLGLSLQEALYYECASIGSNVGGIPELIEHETNGLLVPSADEGALAAALDRLMSSPELRARLTRNARQSILDKGMLAEIMVEKYIRLYEGILARKKVAAL